MGRTMSLRSSRAFLLALIAMTAMLRLSVAKVDGGDFEIEDGDTSSAGISKAAEQEAPKPTAYTEGDFKKMRVKQLRTFLHQRGVDCKGCTEKTEFVQKAMASTDLPLMEEEKEEPSRGEDDQYTTSFDGVKGMEGLQDMMKGMDPSKFKLSDAQMKEINAKTKENVAKNFPDDEKAQKEAEATKGDREE